MRGCMVSPQANSLPVRGWYHIWTQLHVLDVPLSIKLSLYVLRKQWKMARTLGPLHPRGRLGRSFWLPASAQLSSCHCGHLESDQQLEGLSLFLVFLLCKICLSNRTKKKSIF